MPTLYQELRSLYEDRLEKIRKNPTLEKELVNNLWEHDAAEIAKRYGARGAQMGLNPRLGLGVVEVFCKRPVFTKEGVGQYFSKLRLMGYLILGGNSDPIMHENLPESTKKIDVWYHSGPNSKTVAVNMKIDHEIEENNQISFSFFRRYDDRTPEALDVIYPIFGLSNAPTNLQF